MTTIRFSTDYLVNVLTDYKKATDKHFELFGLYGSRIIIQGYSGNHSAIELIPDYNLFFKERGDGRLEYIAKFQYEPTTFDRR